MKISIITINLNSGNDLLKTVNNIIGQSYKNFELIIKDGVSTDNSLKELPNDTRLKMVIKKDQGIFDAMNQGLDYITGDFVVFVNAGDEFYDIDTLEKVVNYIKQNNTDKTIFYGDCFTVNKNSFVHFREVMDDTSIMNEIISHPATFYSINYIINRRFDLKYHVTADYEFYVRALKIEGCAFIKIPFVVARYLGGGFSESKKNRVIGYKEVRLIQKKYLDNKANTKYLLRFYFTGKFIKLYISRIGFLSKFYNKVSEFVYNKKHIKYERKAKKNE